MQKNRVKQISAARDKRTCCFFIRASPIFSDYGVRRLNRHGATESPFPTMFIDEKSGKMFTWILGYDLRRIVEAREPRYDHSGAPFFASKFRICGLSVLCCSAGNGPNGDFCLRQSRDMLRCTT